MAELERTDREIDDTIREWRLRLKDMPAVLNVSRQRVQDRWEWFRQEVYNRIAAGKSSAEIVQEVGLPPSAIAGFRASWTRGYRPPQIGLLPEPEPDDGARSDEIDDAVVTTFGLERDLQRSLRENIAQLEVGLKIIDGGSEHRCAAGHIDILCEDGQGALVIVELKAGLAKDAALGQVLGYMGAIKREMTAEAEHVNRPVRGIMVAKEFSERMRYASLAVPTLRLVSYSIHFSFEELKY